LSPGKTSEGTFVKNNLPSKLNQLKLFVSQGGRVLKSTFTKTLLVAIVATIVMPLANQAAAQDESSAGGLVAVLDVARVFKENQNFESKMASIKSEADGLKSQIEAQMTALQGEAQQLVQYEVGSSERNQLEASLEQRQTSLRTKARQAEADLLNREARIYYETYEEMKSVVGSIAGQHGIALVLRFDSSPIDPENRPEVIKGVNRSVVFHRKLDLTSMVISKMGTSTAQAPTQSRIIK
jgi:Skp family chaperone for outer membrane proteins